MVMYDEDCDVYFVCIYNFVYVDWERYRNFKCEEKKFIKIHNE